MLMIIPLSRCYPLFDTPFIFHLKKGNGTTNFSSFPSCFSSTKQRSLKAGKERAVSNMIMRGKDTWEGCSLSMLDSWGCFSVGWVLRVKALVF